MRKHFATLTALLLIAPLSLFALNRDYKSDCDEDSSYQSYYYPYCARHAPDGYPDWIESGLVKFIPATGAECLKCYDQSIYLGHVDPDFKKYRSHLEQQLEYCRQHTNCNCYWSEYSLEAAQISDSAYILFRDLISTTALSSLLDNDDEQRNFINNPGWFLNKHGLTISFIAQQFRFSDYYHVCKDIANYAAVKYEEREAAKIKDKLDDILEALYPKFFALHTACHEKHPSPDIEQEIRFMKLLVGDISGLEETVTANTSLSSYYDNKSYDVSEYIINNLRTAHYPVELENKGFKAKKSQSQHESFECSTNAFFTTKLNADTDLRTFSIESEIFLELGSVLNDFMLYKDAIKVLTEAIKLNSSNRDAYVERAMAYFETNQLSLAKQDYHQAKKLTVVPPFKTGRRWAMMRAIYIPENKKDFSSGLVSGTLKGATVSANEFIPSILSCCRGILNGLWAFVCSPVEVSQEMVNTAYAIGEFISNHSTEECLHCVVPELKELSLSWEKLNDHSRGQEIGFIIGKYGVDIFAPLGTLKGVNKVRALKRANTMCTLESCVASEIKQAKIFEESAKRASIREIIISESIKNGKILVKNSNAQVHIMQPKHAWDKLIKISGNVEEDCKKVVKLLEDNKIFLEKYKKNTTIRPEFTRFDYQMQINGFEVKAVFNKNPETGEIFLNDAWVVIK